MSTNIQRAKQGRPLAIRARDYNAMAEAAEAHQRHRLDSGRGVRSFTTYAVFVVSSSTKHATNWKWTYTGKEARKTTAGIDGAWTAWSGSPAYTLYNLAEHINGASGVLGNGVDTANLTDTAIEPQPIPNNAVVFCGLVPVSDGSHEWWILGTVNGLDGACE